MPPRENIDLSEIGDVAGSTRTRTPQRPAPSGQGRGRMIGRHVPEEVYRLFNTTRAEHGLTAENALAEALNDWFAKHGKAEICPVKEPGRKKSSN